MKGTEIIATMMLTSTLGLLSAFAWYQSAACPRMGHWQATNQALKSLCWRIDLFLRECPDAYRDFHLRELLGSRRACTVSPHATAQSLQDSWGQPILLRHQGSLMFLLSNGPDTELGTPDDLNLRCERFAVESDNPLVSARR